MRAITVFFALRCCQQLVSTNWFRPSNLAPEHLRINKLFCTVPITGWWAGDVGRGTWMGLVRTRHDSSRKFATQPVILWKEVGASQNGLH